MVKRLLIVLAAAALFVAGCANSSSTSARSSSTSGPGDSSAAASASPGPVAPSGTSTKLTGTLEAGVEPNCIVLRGDGADHVLFFADAQVKKQAKIGDKVTVVGDARPAQMTTCQQGTPFLVSAMVVD